MIDPVIERKYSDCKELIALWKTFHEFFKLGVRGQDITQDKEAKFLEIKSRIAMLHDSFLESLDHDQNIGQNIINIVTRCITLKHLYRLSPAEIKKMEIEWHESYLLLNETIGVLEEKKEALATVNPTRYKIHKFKENLITFVNNFVASIYLKIVLVVGGLIFVLFGVPALGIYDYKNLRKTSLKPAYDIGATAYRMISSSYPYDELSQVYFNKTFIGNQFKAEPDFQEGEILNDLAVVPGLVGKINEQRLEFKGRYYTVNGLKLFIAEFKLSTTSDAADGVRMFKDWYTPLSTEQKKNPTSKASQLLVCNQRNALIIIYFNPTLYDNAKQIKEQVYRIIN